jgi:hypothetical protein
MRAKPNELSRRNRSRSTATAGGNHGATHLRLIYADGWYKGGVIWDLSVKKIDDQTCEFINMVHSFTTSEFMDFLGKQGIPFEVFQTAP